MKKLLMSLFLTTASTVFAGPGGSDVGNGGDVVVCHDQQGNLQSVESLDVFEWNKMNSNIPIAVFAGLSSDQIIDRVFKKIETQIPSLVSNALKPGYEQFKTSSTFVAGISLVDIKDSDHSLIPNGCSIEQIAIQKEPLLPWEKYFTINESLWTRMSDVNKAALILHEIIFREALMNMHVNSILTRKMTGFFLSTLFEASTSPDYLLSALEKTKIFRALIEQNFVIIYNNVVLKVSPPIAELKNILQSNNYKITELKGNHDLFVKKIIDQSWIQNSQLSETKNLEDLPRFAIHTVKTYTESLSMFANIQGLDFSYIEKYIKPKDTDGPIKIKFLFHTNSLFKLDHDYADAEIQIELDEAEDVCAGLRFSNLKLKNAFRQPMARWLFAGTNGDGNLSRFKILDLPKGTIIKDPTQKLTIPEIRYDSNLNLVMLTSTVIHLISTKIVDYLNLRLKAGTEFNWEPGRSFFPLSKKLELGEPSDVRVSVKYLTYGGNSTHKFAANTVVSRVSDPVYNDLFFIESGEVAEEFMLEHTGYGMNQFKAQAGAKVKDNKLVFPIISAMDFEIAPQDLAQQYADRKRMTLRFVKGFEFNLNDSYFEIQGDLVADLSFKCLFIYSNDDTRKIYYREFNIHKNSVSMKYDHVINDLVNMNFNLTKPFEEWPIKLDISKRIQIDDGCYPKEFP